MIGVMRKRANSGMTIPAAPRMTSASDSSGEARAVPAAMHCMLWEARGESHAQRGAEGQLMPQV
jgi:hypothetical protein